MNRYILAVICPTCDNIIKDDSYTVDFTADENTVFLDNFACTHFCCSNCGTNVYVGDIDDLYEYEEADDGDG